MLHARIIVLALVAILITAGVAVALGSVGGMEKAGAQTPVLADNGNWVMSPDGRQCSYQLPIGTLLRDGDTTEGLEYRLANGDFYPSRDVYPLGGTKAFLDHGHFEIGPFSILAITLRAYDHAFRDYPSDPEEDDNHYWQIWEDGTYYGGARFDGPYWKELDRELLECARTPPTPTPSPIPTATPESTPTPTVTATPTATAVVSPPVVIPGPATPTPTATPRTSPAVTQPTATPTASPTATPVSGGEEPSVDDSDIVAAILALIEVLKVWIEMQQ